MEEEWTTDYDNKKINWPRSGYKATQQKRMMFIIPYVPNKCNSRVGRNQINLKFDQYYRENSTI
jgi:hypothetical protein